MHWHQCGVLLVLCVCPLVHLMTTPCPLGCCCARPGLVVLCESLGLKSLPRSVPLGTSALSVARNQLCNVDHLLRPFSSLQELSLSQNQLTRFPRGLPPSLETLQLQENHITYITSGALRQLGNLTRLDLDDNRIRAIQPGALQGLRRLQILTLKGNKLTRLPFNLPPSLTYLDLSANCISTLDLPSLSALVNLQSLKINSNCLRSVPENAFDSLLRLRSVELANNLWVCECDILYLYHWLLSGRLKMATDLVCSEPVHLAHRLLLNLSVIAICPQVVKLNERTSYPGFSFRLDRKLENNMETDAPSVQFSDANTANFALADRSLKQKLIETYKAVQSFQVHNIHSVPVSRTLPQRYSLETLSYEECLSLTTSVSLMQVNTTASILKEPRCLDNATGLYPLSNSTFNEGAGPLLSTKKVVSLPTSKPSPFSQDSSVVIPLLAVLCVLVAFLILAVLFVLKKILIHQQRVSPLHQS